MSNDATTRWTVSVLKEAVKWRVLDQTIAEARGKFSSLPPEELETLLEDAVLASRQADGAKTR